MVDSKGNVLHESEFHIFGELDLHRSFSAVFSVVGAHEPAKINIVVKCEHASPKTTSTTVSIKLMKKKEIAPQFFFLVNSSAPDSKQTDKFGNYRGVSEEDRKKIIVAFNEADADKNGQLSIDEFMTLLTKFYPSISPPECNQIYSAMDSNRNGKIDLEEFLHAFSYCGWEFANYQGTAPHLNSIAMGSAKAPPIPSKPQQAAAAVAAPVQAAPPAVKHDAVSKEAKSAEKFEWEIEYEELRMGEKLGEGAFGIVNKAKWRGISVAVKQLKINNMTNDVLADFQKELGLLAKLRHPNVVLLMGASTKPPNLTMVTEFLNGGSLFDAIHTRKQQFQYNTIIKIALQAAAGLNYLHLSHPPIIHRDFKSMNLLLDSDNNAKICDFGLSCIKNVDENVSTSVGSPFWMAPEVWQSKPYDSKVDVYSFGVVLFEMMTGNVPLSEIVTSNPQSLQVLRARVCEGHRAPIPSYIAPGLAALMSNCWANDPSARPTFDTVIDKLEEVANQILSQPPPNTYPNYYFDHNIGQYVMLQQPQYYHQVSYTATPSQNQFAQEHQQFIQDFQTGLQF
eukprot:TRINITY_DN4638_c0_g1_i1.p1 TRINITY_DN4638_c0_g1~~TRINITY_DN4638_c0_g1_i1.p1  ORF type:complete len:638 (+),score=270.87 TRINITY_DN4638_c0_g1_i1:222-1916(+)